MRKKNNIYPNPGFKPETFCMYSKRNNHYTIWIFELTDMVRYSLK